MTASSPSTATRISKLIPPPAIVVGTAFIWWGRSRLFDLASNPLETVKVDPGFLVGPALILILLMLVGLPATLTMWPRDLPSSR